MATAAVRDAPEHKPRWRFTVDNFRRMAEVGIIPADARVELIDGEIVPMGITNPPHAWVVMWGDPYLKGHYGQAAVVNVGNALEVDEHTQRNPDFVLLPLPIERYRGRIPTAAEALLVIEVSDASARRDRREKLPLYARAGVRECWLIDLAAGALEVHRDPGPDGYRSARAYRGAEPVAPLAFPELHVTYDGLTGATGATGTHDPGPPY